MHLQHLPHRQYHQGLPAGRPPRRRLARAFALALALPALATPPALLAQGSAAPEAAETPDPVQQTWVWLATAPQAEPGPAPTDLGPGFEAFDRLASAAHEPGKAEPDALVRAALAARLSRQLVTLPLEERGALLETLSQHEALAAELAFHLCSEDDPAAAHRLLGRLLEHRAQRPEDVAELAPLAAAICSVHDQPRDRRVNEHQVPLIDAVALFDYFESNERTLEFDPRTTPASLLVFVADANGSIDQLDWARRRYGRDGNVGNRYHEITYDTRALRQEGIEKKVTASGQYDLESIRRHGGVCAVQAYFAMTVGKASGIPTCYVVGRGGEVSHAWVGFLEEAGRDGARWNFSEGRYEAFEDVQGTVLHPQTWSRVPDAYLSIAAYETWAKPQDRRRSTALTDAAARIGALSEAYAGPADVSPEIRARQLDLLEQALRHNSGNLPAWELARSLLSSPGLSLDQRERWARAIDQLAGQASPDFAFEMLEPMFNAESDPKIRFNFWDWAAQRYAGRKDLPARARLAQARIMVEQGRPADAYEAARTVFEQYHEAGPVAMQALALAEQLLSEQGTTPVELYQWAFRQLRQPSRMQSWALRQTVWHQVGTRYAQLAEQAGDTRTAASVRRRLDR